MGNTVRMPKSMRTGGGEDREPDGGLEVRGTEAGRLFIALEGSAMKRFPPCFSRTSKSKLGLKDGRWTGKV